MLLKDGHHVIIPTVLSESLKIRCHQQVLDSQFSLTELINRIIANPGWRVLKLKLFSKRIWTRNISKVGDGNAEWQRNIFFICFFLPSER